MKSRTQALLWSFAFLVTTIPQAAATELDLLGGFAKHELELATRIAPESTKTYLSAVELEGRSAEALKKARRQALSFQAELIARGWTEPQAAAGSSMSSHLRPPSLSAHPSAHSMRDAWDSMRLAKLREEIILAEQDLKTAVARSAARRTTLLETLSAKAAAVATAEKPLLSQTLGKLKRSAGSLASVAFVAALGLKAANLMTSPELNAAAPTGGLPQIVELRSKAKDSTATTSLAAPVARRDLSAVKAN